MNDAHLLTIDESMEAGVVRLTLRGELDSATAPAVEEALAAGIGKAPAGLVVNIATLDFIGAAGLRWGRPAGC